MRVVTAKEMAGIEEAAEKHGVSRAQMMENAGRNAALEAIKLLPGFKRKKICVLCGKGNNGGDGFVAARHLGERGTSPEVFIFNDVKDLSPLAKKNLGLLRKSGGNVHSVKATGGLARDLRDCGAVIDALFGTGFRGEIKGIEAEAISLLNSTDSLKISIDVPSGLNADNGEVNGACVAADHTFTLGLPKKGLMLFPGAEYAGKIKVLDIGIPRGLVGTSWLNMITREDAASVLEPRKQDTHKGTYGRVFIISGSAGMTGATTLACLGALRSGAGLVTAGVPASLNNILEIKLTEAMTKPLPETENRSLGEEAFGEILRFSEETDAVAVGPGLSRAGKTCRLAVEIIEGIGKPMVIDADAIFALKGNAEILKKRKASTTIITPHPGEMAFLTGKTIGEIQSRRIEAAKDFSAEYGVVTVLKGARTVIACPEGNVWINLTGNPGMATGGSGDVLAGIMAALLGQKISALGSAKTSVYIHGLAGDLAAEEKGEIGVIASDIAEKVPYAIKSIMNQQQGFLLPAPSGRGLAPMDIGADNSGL
ncbi:bifunctional ADP-dependent NAD(P)H-hydrate dehydratase/NAD(P)H-hydrate epimerase [Candidatus Desantisbacteria bacterium CG_4_10_14_0_8_um_filter_48_22]|uniref:Bifunctional NAD(P)H-hydrate repair enzyme n=1 Tax=Candidatus Desantisbacteria bacterium CG_4_10_14_0_8_um_filter_48_22 TaxID=1974543 RepID=A0A2M7S504_9BACT|nr:MAG: hypothetical protein AUJ67_09925 [Candidatus Desantisbacteria bacterium CG1_02_49_89]PIV54283.1 MAG: bifunctional ADP-dependent NAD(P)H-hydrate dehydratase/NAD(P)H-hydrate epimerase [Candidatus Desantisbacteria bacterium CG02_land_8_20_14_3_00_49_13]PIZ14509.1 MAG: bifunctional ADP-dependent NAD(P)H-hydrate dehydratase/NAD(P)H-hydrate epimerase [Candidatus Desantisbacteria bacterium CG_4_10_14_0_8_um_filter_48_22]PJB27404.1 MAG: bifunctional ADP-dependent NAD(P)H-hydrate dehydratase/NAD(